MNVKRVNFFLGEYAIYFYVVSMTKVSNAMIEIIKRNRSRSLRFKNIEEKVHFLLSLGTFFLRKNKRKTGMKEVFAV